MSEGYRKTETFLARSVNISVHPEGWVECKFSIPGSEIILSFTPDQAEILAKQMLDAARKSEAGQS